ncbi:MAG: hypothetical protein OXU62_04275 [Gammaproteobacteria bacterium]|nr:hypothetical protein [Gammaproteobacteria bacterium]MDD9883750.1 hypothetical protein [Gammaproteobacteria bacterium]
MSARRFLTFLELENVGFERVKAAHLAAALYDVKRDPSLAEDAVADLRSVGFTRDQSEKVIDFAVKYACERETA